MNPGDLEGLPNRIVKAMNDLEIRIMDDVVRRIKINGFSTAGADWQIDRLRQLGMSEKEIKEWVRQTMETTEEEIDRIFSDEVYEQYMKQGRGYKVYGREQIPFEENFELQQLIEAVKRQANDEMEQITGSMGFVRMDPMGRTHPESLSSFYTRTLDDAMYDIHSGAFDYNTVLKRTIEDMTKSGLRWIDYESGWHNRVPVAARRAVMTGFRQVQGKINEQTAEALGTDSYEVTVHIGARPTHQVWEGKIWTMTQLRTVCGLGEVTGLHGANCYHDYNPFIPGVDVPAYSQEELDQIHKQENTPKRYNGKEYTTYQALQRQRKLETRARKYREDVHLLEEGGGSEDDIIAKKCRYQGTLQEYRDFSKKMDLPMQKERIYQDGLKVDMRAPKNLEDTRTIKDISKRQTGGKETGGHNYKLDEYASEKDIIAAREYRRISREYDADKIAKSSGFPEEDIVKIKRHLFFEKHKLYEKYDYLAPDYDIAVAWNRLKEGNPEPRDIILLEHERLESYLEKEYNLTISEAHEKANRIYNWEKALKDAVGEGGEPDGLL